MLSPSSDHPRHGKGLPRLSPVVAMLLVLCVHASGLAALLWTPVEPAAVISLPTIQGVIIPLPPAEEVQAPSQQEDVTPPEPLPVKPKPKPKPKPEPEPLPELPPSETAIATPPQEVPEAEPEPAPPNTPMAEEDDTLGAPITPPFVDANQVSNPAPAYPALSRRLREQGVVLLDVLILPDGSVGEIRIRQSSGHQRLDDTALEAVRQWKYMPARRGAEPIPYWYVQPLEFSLN